MARTLDAATRARLQKRFAAIPERMKAAARKTVGEEAEAMADEMRRGAPRDDGDLQASILATDVSDEDQVRWKVTAGGDRTRRQVEGSERFYDYALGTEFGNSRVQAQPFFYPTYRRRRRRFRAKLSRDLAKAAKEP